MAQVSYAAFLSWLLSFSQKLPLILEKLNTAIRALTELATLATETVPSLDVVQPSDEEAGLETQVAQLVAGPTAAFDGSRLRAAFKFLNDSGLLPVIISLLTKAA